MIVVELDRILRERRMTASELCAIIGLTEANLSILRSGKARAIRFTTLDAICRALSVTPGDILGWKEGIQHDDVE
ncbi:MAG: helix-turn-helix transcriptional regulator [Candidatus Izemoplasmatales bacterium]